MTTNDKMVTAVVDAAAEESGRGLVGRGGNVGRRAGGKAMGTAYVYVVGSGSAVGGIHIVGVAVMVG